MENSSHPISLSEKLALAAGLLGSLGLALCVAGCSSATTKNSSGSSPSSTPQQTAPMYMAPAVSGTTYGSVAYSLDETNNVFEVNAYNTLSSTPNVASLTVNAGVVAAGPRGLHTLATESSYTYVAGSPGAWIGPTSYKPPLPGGFAVELSGQDGGMVQLAGLPVVPVVNAAQCPGSSTQTYQIIAIPAVVSGNTPVSWNPVIDTAYGSVDVSSSGSTVNFQNIHQFTLPTAGGTGAPAQPAASPVTGTCGPTLFGNVTNVPGQLTITDPGSPDGSTTPPQAMIGIGASNGLLVEDNGSGALGSMPGTDPPLKYNNILGAGTGAVGLAKPSSALDAGAVVGAQYLGFIYDAGVYTAPSSTYPLGIKNLSSHLVSFSFSSASASCASFVAQTGTLSNGIYGGDFKNDDPSTYPSGNCDVAIDLGTQDSANNGLYPQATVWIGAAYAGNTAGNTYAFPAVAIAGQINGKYAIFLIGFDSVQPWAIYLLQSN
jgi:hypothetical protein